MNIRIFWLHAMGCMWAQTRKKSLYFVALLKLVCWSFDMNYFAGRCFYHVRPPDGSVLSNIVRIIREAYFRRRLQRQTRALSRGHQNRYSIWGQNSWLACVLGLLSCLMQCCGFGSLLKIFLVEGVLPLELPWVLNPFPKNSLGWEYKPRSSLCTHALHHTHTLKRSWHSCPRWVNAGNKNAPSMHLPWRWNVTISMVGFKKNGHTCKNFTENGEP